MNGELTYKNVYGKICSNCVKFVNFFFFFNSKVTNWWDSYKLFPLSRFVNFQRDRRDSCPIIYGLQYKKPTYVAAKNQEKRNSSSSSAFFKLKKNGSSKQNQRPRSHENYSPQLYWSLQSRRSSICFITQTGRVQFHTRKKETILLLIVILLLASSSSFSFIIILSIF